MSPSCSTILSTACSPLTHQPHHWMAALLPRTSRCLGARHLHEGEFLILSASSSLTPHFLLSRQQEPWTPKSWKQTRTRQVWISPRLEPPVPAWGFRSSSYLVSSWWAFCFEWSFSCPCTSHQGFLQHWLFHNPGRLGRRHGQYRLTRSLLMLPYLLQPQ